MTQQLYPEPQAGDATGVVFDAGKAQSSPEGPAAALAAVLWVVFLASLAIAPAVVIATWKALL